MDNNHRVYCEFLTPEELLTEVSPEVPAIVPVVDELQVQFLTQLRRRRCLAPILAVVGDLSGHQTFRAMANGATSVLNLELPLGKQGSVLRSLFDGRPESQGPCSNHASSGGREDGGRRPAFSPELALNLEKLAALSGPDGLPGNPELLIDMLRGPNTIAAIARRFYCSERSMYRYVRRVYDTLGVSSRTELRAQLVELSS